MVNLFPNELIEHILDDLYFDKSTLLNCALVERAWSCSSQRRIFREIFLTTRGDHSNIGQLNASFNTSPHLASYVQSLGLLTLRSIPETLDTLLVAIIQRVSGVKRLSLCDVDWTGLSPLLRESLTDMFRAPSLIHLSLPVFDISSFTELTSLLSQMTQLKSLHVDPFCGNWDAMGFVPDLLAQSKGTGTSLPRSTLQHLGLGSLTRGREMAQWFQHESCPHQVENISSLEIYSNIYSETLQYFGANLRELKLMRLDEGACASNCSIDASTLLTTCQNPLMII